MPRGMPPPTGAGEFVDTRLYCHQVGRDCVTDSFPPAVTMPFGEGDSGCWPPRAGGIGAWRGAGVFAPGDDRIDPLPGRFGFVAAHEQRAVALQRIQVQPLVGQPLAVGRETLVQVEVEWFVALASAGLAGVAPPGPSAIEFLSRLVADFSVGDAEAIKAIERRTNHDVKAVEYFIKEQLRDEGVKFDEYVPVGGMIEVPAAAIALPMFIRKLDFLSIGTNDLIQYTLAIDRADDAVAHLYDPLHPAVLRLVADTIAPVTRTASRAAN